MPTFSFFVSDTSVSQELDNVASSNSPHPSVPPRKLRQLRIASKILADEIEYNKLRLANKPHNVQRIAELYDNIIRFRQL